MRRVPPGRHVLVARDPSASAGDESSLGSLDALPPATSHGYAEWDFSGVPDPVMFKRFLDATDYWFDYSDDSCAGSYDSRAGVLRRHRQRSSKRHRCIGRRRRRAPSCLGDWVAPGRGAERPSFLTTDRGRYQCAAGPSA
jgi:hypothetical protein